MKPALSNSPNPNSSAALGRLLLEPRLHSPPTQQNSNLSSLMVESNPENPCPTPQKKTVQTLELGRVQGHFRHPFSHLSVSETPLVIVSNLRDHQSLEGQRRLLRKMWDLEKDRERFIQYSQQEKQSKPRRARNSSKRRSLPFWS